MLPVTFQIPAAIFLVLGGAVACFAGYRFFRVVLGLYGFVLGALLATTVAGAGSTSSLLMWAVVGGLTGALVLNLAYFFGVVLVGAALGAMAVTLVWSRASGDPHVLIVVAFAVVGALAAMWLQRYVVVTGTAFGGAWTLLVGVLALMGDTAAQAATVSDVWVVYPLDPAPGRRWLPAVWLVLGVVGMFVQLRKGAPRLKKVKRK
jgi:hypothetical protein